MLGILYERHDRGEVWEIFHGMMGLAKALKAARRCARGEDHWLEFPGNTRVDSEHAREFPRSWRAIFEGSDL